MKSDQINKVTAFDQVDLPIIAPDIISLKSIILDQYFLSKETLYK